jgi:hypothetical protein
MYLGLNMPIPTATTVAPVQPTTYASATTMTPAGVVFYDWLIAVVAVCVAVALICAVVIVALKRTKTRTIGKRPLFDY